MAMRTILNETLTALATFLVIWALSFVALKTTGVPDGFPPFTKLPLASGVAGGFLGCSALYALIRVAASNPNRMFCFVAIAYLVLSFALPVRLSFTKSPRFAGVTPAAQMMLVLFHTIVAACSVSILTHIGAGVRR